MSILGVSNLSTSYEDVHFIIGANGKYKRSF